MTSMLTREEMHARVDHLFDKLEEHCDDEIIAVIGGFTGNVNLHAPNQKKDTYRVRGGIGYPGYAFEGAGIQPGQGIDHASSRTHSGLFGTLLVPRSDLSDVVLRAIDGDEDAREALRAGEVPADD